VSGNGLQKIGLVFHNNLCYNAFVGKHVRGENLMTKRKARLVARKRVVRKYSSGSPSLDDYKFVCWKCGECFLDKDIKQNCVDGPCEIMEEEKAYAKNLEFAKTFAAERKGLMACDCGKFVKPKHPSVGAVICNECLFKK
jgi:hypothetical protein